MDFAQQQAYTQLVRARLAKIQANIADALALAGRQGELVRVIGVSKYVDAAHASLLEQAGLTDLGENRFQVAEPKLALELGVNWHFIGPVQSNKARRILRHFSLIHSVDSQGLASTLERLAVEEERAVRILVQVNSSGEAQKAGVRPADLEALLLHCQTCPHLIVDGLMMIGSNTGDTQLTRKEMESVRLLRDQMIGKVGLPLQELSMGMSADYAEAVIEGATMVRIGRLLVSSEDFFDKGLDHC